MLAEALNVRAGPGTGYRLMQVVTKGKRYEVLGYGGGGDCVRISLGGGSSGWVTIAGVEIE